jgi:hypothetical protein
MSSLCPQSFYKTGSKTQSYPSIPIRMSKISGHKTIKSGHKIPKILKNKKTS